jgi:hypothetical protein
LVCASKLGLKCISLHHLYRVRSILCTSHLSYCSMQLTYEHRGCQMSSKDLSRKEASESGISGITYGRVDFIHAEARIQVCKWCDRWPDPGCRECRLSANVRCVVGVEDLCLYRLIKREISLNTISGPRTGLREYDRRRYLCNYVRLQVISSHRKTHLR